MTEGRFDDWIGRSVATEDVVTASPIARLAATLGHDGAHWSVGMLPLLGHWLFHLSGAPRDTLGADGHPALGGFMPPVGYPRRMWAGGRLRFLGPVPVGATLDKRTTIAAVAEKPGMTFVTLRHDLSVDGVERIVEEQDLVYLPITEPRPPKRVERPAPAITRAMTSDEVLLFRFSALTFNGHRIHYDAPYAREVELYPGLVVHGPLQAMLLIELATGEGIVPAAFSFRGHAPLFLGRAFTLAMAGNELWITDEGGTVTMTAETTPA